MCSELIVKIFDVYQFLRELLIKKMRNGHEVDFGKSFKNVFQLIKQES
jgi:hypothetical protein